MSGAARPILIFRKPVVCTRPPMPGFGACLGHEDCRERSIERATRAALNELMRGEPTKPKSRRRCAPPSPQDQP